MRVIPIALALVAGLVVACDGGETPAIPTVDPAPGAATATATQPALATATSPDPAGTATGTPPDGVPSGALALDHACVNESDGYEVGYPAGWHANPGDEPPACTYFDPQPFTVPEATEFFRAINVIVDPVSFADVRPSANENRAIEIVETDEWTVDGRDAVLVQARTTVESALLPPETLVYQYIVDLDGRTLTASTYALQGYDFEQNRDVLDRMMETMVIE